jgi:hypothetical protein
MRYRKQAAGAIITLQYPCYINVLGFTACLEIIFFRKWRCDSLRGRLDLTLYFQFKPRNIFKL